ncbi:MAG: isocitrate lyase/phosphoenolpyruvate mutase family protein, partial [Pseudomonadota bacterium]
MANQAELAGLFKSLHKPGDPVVLFNIWDAGSAKAVAGSGARAIATGSAPVAMANGFPDGEKFSLDDALTNAARILDVIDIPLTMDLEGGYGPEPETVAQTISRAMDIGVVGFNFEDQIVGGQGLYSITDQVARLKAVRQAADANGVGGFVNARTDIFLKAKPDAHTEQMVDDAIERARAYEQAGADGFFAPGMVDKKQIARLCEAVSLPVNMIVLDHTPTQKEFSELGASRISYGPTPYRHMVKWLQGRA